MGIPTIRYHRPEGPPEGYKITYEFRSLRPDDLVWDTRKGEWTERPKWLKGNPTTDEFYGIAEKKDEE